MDRIMVLCVLGGLISFNNATFLCNDSRISPVTFPKHHLSLGLCIFGWILLMRSAAVAKSLSQYFRDMWVCASRERPTFIM
jgi:hypothetical protein